MNPLTYALLRLSRCGIELPKSSSAAANTPPESTCGLRVPSSQRCGPGNPCSRGILRLTKYSKSSSEHFSYPPPSFSLLSLPFPLRLQGHACQERNPMSKNDGLANRSRLLGTPDETSWPGVTSFPDFKPTFPKWSREETAKLCPKIEEAGLDLLDSLLMYDPSKRISAKQGCVHPYFSAGSAAYSGRDRDAVLGAGRNGYR